MPIIPLLFAIVNGLPEEEIRATMRAVNYYRRMAGLSKANYDLAIGRAAQNHAEYRIANWGFKESAHVETPGNPGFTGHSSGDRMAAAGYRGRPFGECIAYGDDTGAAAVDGLMSVPYHRIRFIAGDELAIGFGMAKDPSTTWPRKAAPWVFNYAGSASPLVLWPPDGAKLVPPDGDVAESPDPMRIHSVRPSRVGYVLTASVDRKGYQFVSFSLADRAGAIIPTLVNHPGNDDTSPMRFLFIPTVPLRPFSDYFATFQYRTPEGRLMERGWRFTTGDSKVNFEYRNALARFPGLPKGGKRYRGRVQTVSMDESSIEVAEVIELTAPKNSRRRLKALFQIAATSKLRLAIDPLGVDMDRVVPRKGAVVLFTVAPDRASVIHQLVIDPPIKLTNP